MTQEEYIQIKKDLKGGSVADIYRAVRARHIYLPIYYGTEGSKVHWSDTWVVDFEDGTFEVITAEATCNYNSTGRTHHLDKTGTAEITCKTCQKMTERLMEFQAKNPDHRFGDEQKR